MTTTPAQKTRLRRKDWLARAMDVLIREGEARLNINHLCRELGVTKGSFYAHFRDRADFVGQFVEHWRTEFTESVVSEINAMEDQSAQARLLEMMRLIHRKQLIRYDIVVRAWATHDSTVAEGVRQVDRIRFETVRRIFRDMGFRGTELDLRTRLFVVFHGSYDGLDLPPPELKPETELELRHAFFCRK